MPAPTGVTALQAERPWARLWFAAATEIAVAAVVGAILLHYGGDVPMSQPITQMHPHHHTSQAVWTPWQTSSAAITLAALIWWIVRRSRAAPALAALGLFAVAVAEPVRTLALQSHLIAMAALEALLVGVPLLLIAALPPSTSELRASRGWNAGVGVAVVIYAVFLIALHLPAVHSRAAASTAVPLWLAIAASVVGTGFWTAILRTDGHVTAANRHTALIVGQEVAAVLGLAALFLPSPFMQHANPLGFSSAVDQRLGGALMLATCAAATLPLAKRLKAQLPPPIGAQTHVH